MSDDRGTPLFHRDSLALEDLAEAAPSRAIPRWLILLAVFCAGLATMGIVISQVASFGSAAETATAESELAAAYDRGFQAGEDSGAQAVAAESNRAAVANYRRGVEAGRRVGKEYLATCPAEILQWPLGGIEDCPG